MIDERRLALEAVRLMEDRKGENVVVIDLGDVSIPTSYFVVAGADNPTHAKALVNALRKGLPMKPLRSEGVTERKWIVLDYGDIVVHILEKDAREFYDIESLWADHIVPVEKIQADA
jgi:ribosome-associated protein